VKVASISCHRWSGHRQAQPEGVASSTAAAGIGTFPLATHLPSCHARLLPQHDTPALLCPSSPAAGADVIQQPAESESSEGKSPATCVGDRLHAASQLTAPPGASSRLMLDVNACIAYYARSRGHQGDHSAIQSLLRSAIGNTIRLPGEQLEPALTSVYELPGGGGCPSNTGPAAHGRRSDGAQAAHRPAPRFQPAH